MYDDVQLSLPDTLDREVIFKQLEKVLDPELDESILKLGFVKSIEVESDHLTIELHLPTYWCAPNFSYMMAEDTRRELLTVEGIHDVTVRLKDHFAARTIEASVNAGKSFSEAFPDEASENLCQLSDLFLRKGYIRRQERLLRNLKMRVCHLKKSLPNALATSILRTNLVKSGVTMVGSVMSEQLKSLSSTSSVERN